ncbi:MAG: c-type cytochrome [Ignavibacteriae bacterium]|nr:c-type cytochrome [Ignavibacteriota bacterium]
MSLRNIAIMPLLSALVCLAACGNSGEQPRTEAAEVPKPPVYGKIQNVELASVVDAPLAKKGEKIFKVICTACHKYDQRYVGPAIGSVFNRRTPEYIMNMILDTEVMLQKDDTARCLLQTYLVKMPNAQVNETDARSVLEHLRDIAPQYK